MIIYPMKAHKIKGTREEMQYNQLIMTGADSQGQNNYGEECLVQILSFIKKETQEKVVCIEFKNL